MHVLPNFGSLIFFQYDKCLFNFLNTLTHFPILIVTTFS